MCKFVGVPTEVTGSSSSIFARRWLDSNVSGKLCNLAGLHPCKEQHATAQHSLDFQSLRPIWLEEQAELQLALALAVGDQQLYSNFESLHLKLGPPSILEVLLLVQGRCHNGTVVDLDAYSEMHAAEGFDVVLKRYQPYIMKELVLYLALPLPDSAFTTQWALDDAEVVNATGIRFRHCEENLFLKHRFEVCRSAEGLPGGWKTPVARVSLSPWNPEETSLHFQLMLRRPQGEHAIRSSTQSVNVRLEGVEAASAWAIPQAGGQRDQCMFLACPEVGDNASAGLMEPKVIATPLPSPRGITAISIGFEKAAACEYMRRHCTFVPSCAWHNKTVLGLIEENWEHAAVALWGSVHAESSTTLSIPLQTRVHRGLSRQMSKRYWQFLRCSMETGRSVNLSTICNSTRCPRLWVNRTYKIVLDDPDTLCCDTSSLLDHPGYQPYNQHLDIYRAAVSLEAVQLAGTLSTVPTTFDEELVQQTCSVLYRRWTQNAQEQATEDQKAERRKLERKMFRAAIASQNLQAVELIFRHCISIFTHHQASELWSLQAKGFNVVGLFWDDFPHYVGQLLQSAVDNRCISCISDWQRALPSLAECQDLQKDHALSLHFDATPSVQELPGGFLDKPDLNQTVERDLLAFLPLLSSLLQTTCVLPFISVLKLRLLFSWFLSVPENLMASLQSIFSIVSSNNSSLTSLELEGWKFPATEKGDHFGNDIRRMKMLHVLRLKRCDVTAEKLAQLFASMPFPQLRELDLSHNPLGDSGVAAVAQLMPRMPFIQKLDLSHVQNLRVFQSDTHKEGYRSAVRLLRTSLTQLQPCRLKSLSLWPCGLISKLIELIQDFSHCPDLETITMCARGCPWHRHELDLAVEQIKEIKSSTWLRLTSLIVTDSSGYGCENLVRARTEHQDAEHAIAEHEDVVGNDADRGNATDPRNATDWGNMTQQGNDTDQVKPYEE